MINEIEFNYYIENYFKTRKNKRYGKDSIKYEINWIPLLIRDISNLKDKTFRIKNNYAFLTSIPKWREIFATEFSGRLVDHEVCDLLNLYIEKILSPRTYNNRIGKGAQAAINQVIEDMNEVSKNYTQKSWIIKLDFKGFFPHALWNYAEKYINKIIEKYIENEDKKNYLKWLSMIIIHANPAAHCELRTPKYYWNKYIDPDKSLLSKPEGEGAAIGRLIWQTAMGLYINDEIKWLNEICNVRAVCFVDDIVIQVPDNKKSYVLSLIPELRKRLATKNISLNEKKFYCQLCWHGLEFLGSHIKPYRLHLNNNTYGNAVLKIKEYNKLQYKYFYIDEFMSTVNSYTGLLKNRTDYNRLLKLKNLIDEEWFQWLQWDTRRQCIICKPKYSKRERLNKKYHLKLKKHDTK